MSFLDFTNKQCFILINFSVDALKTLEIFFKTLFYSTALSKSITFHLFPLLHDNIIFSLSD